MLFPGVVLGVLYLGPLFERLVTGDGRPHHLLDRPRDAPWRTAFGAAFFTWILVVFLAGAADQAFVHFDIPHQSHPDEGYSRFSSPRRPVNSRAR